MKVVFFGTPDFAVPALEEIVKEHEVIAVVTQPDRPKNRGHKLEPSPVKKAALAHSIHVMTPDKIKESVDEIPEADAYVVVAYGQIFPKVLLEKPKYGCFNIHASLLPKYRGAAPMQRAIEAGEEFSGVGIMQMDVGLDTGDVLAEESVEMKTMNIAELHDVLSQCGAKLMLRVLADAELQRLCPRKQDNSQASYAKMISKSDYEFSDDYTVDQVIRKIRAFQFLRAGYAGKRIKLYAVDTQSVQMGLYAVDSNGIPPAVNGDRARESLVVQGGKIWLQAADGCIEVTELQPENGKRMPASAFLNGLR